MAVADAVATVPGATWRTTRPASLTVGDVFPVTRVYADPTLTTVLARDMTLAVVADKGAGMTKAVDSAVSDGVARAVMDAYPVSATGTPMLTETDRGTFVLALWKFF